MHGGAKMQLRIGPQQTKTASLARLSSILERLERQLGRRQLEGGNFEGAHFRSEALVRMRRTLSGCLCGYLTGIREK